MENNTSLDSLPLEWKFVFILYFFYCDGFPTLLCPVYTVLSQLDSLLAGLAPLGAAPTTPYTSYTGSLTTPPCSEGVKWINFLTPIKISANQMEKFRCQTYIAL